MRAGLIWLAAVACTDRDTGVADGSSTDTSATSGDPGPTSDTLDDGPSTVDPSNVTVVDDSGTTTPGTDTDSETGTGSTTTGGGCNDTERGCNNQVDLLIVIDNSSTMGEEQLYLARALPQLVQQLEELTDSGGRPVEPDVQVMVTTTDMGNPLCTPFEPAGYDPARGAPTTTGCNARIDDFTGLAQPPVEMPETCTDVCPVDLEPVDPFVAFGPEGDNVPDVPAADVNGDGVLDSPAAQALSCIGPQGINGCGYESQLESMLQALNPESGWNQGDRPFLRDGAVLAIVVITDEVECSVLDFSIMESTEFMETNPDTGTPAATSAICWNAGVTCAGPSADGVYTECTSNDDNGLQPLDRYTDYLLDELRENQGKEIVMLGILGVPIVTANNPEPPYEPTSGGVADLVYREWENGIYPAGDIVPDEWNDGVRAEDKIFTFGNIAPGCTGEDGMGGFTGQGLPNTRVIDVCQSLDLDGELRCCIESVCDDDLSQAMRCLTGLIADATDPID